MDKDRANGSSLAHPVEGTALKKREALCGKKMAQGPSAPQAGPGDF